MLNPGSNNDTVSYEKNRNWVPLFIAVFIALIVDGMDLQILNLCLPVLKNEFALNQIQAGALSSYTLLGMAIGGLLAGLLADKIGRVKVTMISLAMFSSFTLFLGFTQTYEQFAVIRCLSGLGMAGVYSIGTLLVAEYVPTARRGLILGSLQAGYSVGYICAALIAAAILPTHGWRPIFVLAVIPAIASFLLLRKTKEPESFQLASQVNADKKKGNQYALIWQNKTVRYTFLVWVVANTALQFGYFGANTWLPSYLSTDLGMNLKSMSLNIAATYTAMVAGKVMAGFLADKFGRKSVWVTGGLATAVVMPLIVAFVNTSNVIFLMFIFGILYAIPYALLSAFMSESFPGGVRGTCVATTYAIGRIGSVTAPLFIGFIATWHSIGYGIATLGIAYAICAVIPGLFIKEKAYDPSKV